MYKRHEHSRFLTAQKQSRTKWISKIVYIALLKPNFALQSIYGVYLMRNFDKTSVKARFRYWGMQKSCIKN